MSFRIKTRLLIALVILPVVLLAGPPQALAVGSILVVKGEAVIVCDGAEIRPAPGMIIREGDVIRTGKTGEVSIEITGGYIMVVKPDSELQADELGAEKEELRSVMLYSGMVYVRGNPSERGKKPPRFQLQTPAAVAGVRGTEFAVAVAPDGSVMVGVEEGRVEVETDEGETVNLVMRESVEVDPDKKGPLQVAEYLPERDKIENWLSKRQQMVLAHPLPAAKRLTTNLNRTITKAEQLLEEANKMTEFIIREAQMAERKRARGQTPLYMRHKTRVMAALPRLVVKVRTLILLDNRIQARGRMLAWLVRESNTPGSPTPQKTQIALKKHQTAFDALKVRSDNLHAGRIKLLRERIPVLRDSVKYLK